MGKEIRVPIVGIDGLRSVAERTGDYAGNDDPKFDDEEKPTKATVSVFKMVQGTRVEFTATARWSQYVPLKKDKTIASPLWEKMPHLMLGKCAEALALRKAFPQVMSGLYVAEEMHQAQVVEVKVEDDYSKAKRMLEKIADPKELEKALKKIETSEKYDETQKNELGKLIKDRIAILTPKKKKEELPTVEVDGEESEAIQ